MMSPKKSKQNRDGANELNNLALLAGPLVASLVAPIIWRITMNLVEQDHKQIVNSNLFAFAVTSTICAGILVLTNTYIKQFSNFLINDSKQLQAYDHPTFLAKLFAVFTSNSQRTSNNQYLNNSGRNSPFFSSDSLFDQSQTDGQGKRKIDPKYFKPKFIIHELMTFWGTTCTVITWGSFYIIGGTVVMSERLAQKIKAKSKSPRENSSFIFSNSHNTSTAPGFGQNEFSFSSAFGSSQTNTAQASSQSTQRKPPFQRISSWTRRSVQTIRKKLSRTMRTNAPQLTSGPANDSSSSIFFFNNATASS